MHSTLFMPFVFLAAAAISAPIAKRLGLGAVLGYLIAGAVIGPFGLKLLGDPQGVMHAAEFGVVIMLFLIGLELEPALLWRMRGAILGLGGAQVLACGLALAAAGLAFGLDARVAIAVGFTLALSSTAIVMQSLRERGLERTDPGRAAFSVLLFQDVAVIPMLALFPLLAAMPAPAHTGPLWYLPPWGQALAVLAAVGAVIAAGRFLARPLFRMVARADSREIFTATALALVVGVALLMESVGLSPALGAFVAGVVLADSEFRHEIESDIEPFRALLLGLFFISVGAGVDLALVAHQPLRILAIVAGLIAIKAAVLFIVARLSGRARPDAALVVLALAQGGEFAFVLFSFATANGVMSAALAAPLTAAVALSMALSPLLLLAGARLANRLGAAPPRAAPEPFETQGAHVVVAGFGRFGQIAQRLLSANGFRVSILEYNADQVELVRSFGMKANYGDASRAELLRAAGVGEARALIIAVDDQDKAIEIAETARRLFPHLKILARAYDRRHVYELMNVGVDIIERETFEGGLRLGAAALRVLGFAAHRAERAAGLFRRHDIRQLLEMSEHWRKGDFDAYRSAVRARQEMIEDALQRDLGDQGLTVTDDAWSSESLDAEAERRA
ncbi:MAG: monovalent cation:proton antiporter-2 (CPA2) family protein [Hyphomonadaceae bacterium]